MKIFISYARVDKPLCKQVNEQLEVVHEVWYDKRLHAGMDWWNEIQERLAWCEGFVYLLSPESVVSEYCQKEFAIAVESDKHIFPVLIQARTVIPDSLSHIHYADLSEGMEDIITLMNALTIAERRRRKVAQPVVKSPVKIDEPPKDISPTAALAQAADAMEVQNFDNAVFIIKQALTKKPSGRVERMLQTLLNDAEDALEKQAYLREAAREYEPIKELVTREATRTLGCKEFAEFQQEFPDYDPDRVSDLCAKSNIPLSAQQPQSPVGARRASPTTPAPVIPTPPKPKIITAADILPAPFDWVTIPAGEFTYQDGKMTLDYDFQIARYPVTYAQFQTFLDDPEGYRNMKRWFDGLSADNDDKQMKDQRFKDNNHPRDMVNWYQAIAFCRWLSWRLGGAYAVDDIAHWAVRLPTEFEWEKAALANTGWQYPYGDTFHAAKGNTKETGIGKTSAVGSFPEGDTPHWDKPISDLSGNVWEWCLTDYSNPKTKAVDENIRSGLRRVVRGGSWYGDADSARAVYRGDVNPGSRSNFYGFRLCRPPSLKQP